MDQETRIAYFNEIRNSKKAEPKEDLGLSRADLKELYEAKFGKKPHHKKSDAKIMDELNGG